MQVERRVEAVKSRQLVIELPESFVNHTVEVIILTLDEETPQRSQQRRKPPPQFAGKVKELGDVMASVPAADWGMTE